MIYSKDDVTAKANAAYDAWLSTIRDESFIDRAIKDIYQKAAREAGAHTKSLATEVARRPIFFEVAVYGTFCLSIAAAPYLARRQFLVLPGPRQGTAANFGTAVLARALDATMHPGAQARFEMYHTNLGNFPKVGLYTANKALSVPPTKVSDVRLGVNQFARAVALAIDPDFYSGNTAQEEFVPLGREIAQRAGGIARGLFVAGD